MRYDCAVGSVCAARNQKQVSCLVGMAMKSLSVSS